MRAILFRCIYCVIAIAIFNPQISVKATPNSPPPQDEVVKVTSVSFKDKDGYPLLSYTEKFKTKKQSSEKSSINETNKNHETGKRKMINEPNVSAPNDFDFIIGSWRVRHLRLKERLVGSNSWVEFEGTSTTNKILSGLGNLEDNYLGLPEGGYRAVALRSYNVKTKQWAIWWLDGRNPHHLDVPVVGQFLNGIGTFYADDVFNGKPIKVRFIWRISESGNPRWEQAFSEDGGKSWEINWTMDFTRVPDSKK